MSFKLTKNIYEDENFSISEKGGITVYGTTDMSDIIKVLMDKFPEKIKVSKDENRNQIIDLSDFWA